MLKLESGRTDSNLDMLNSKMCTFIPFCPKRKYACFTLLYLPFDMTLLVHLIQENDEEI